MENHKKIKFGTDGWRDIIADSFTFENVRLVAVAIGTYLIENNLSSKGVFIGYDNRFLSEDFALQAGYALYSLGIKIYLSKQPVPTPLTAFMVRDLKLDGAIMITASHNPPKYNGIKFIPEYGGPAEDFITKEIEKNLGFYLDGKKDLPELKKYNEFLRDIIFTTDYRKYKERLIEIIDSVLIRKAGMKVCADVMFGAGNPLMQEMLEELLDINPVIFNNGRDAFFGGKLPDPSEKNLQDFKKTIIKDCFEIGLALDGDADRFGVIDSRGVFISPNNAISIILHYMARVKDLKGAEFSAVRSVATTHLIDEICFKYEINIIETPVGFKFVGKEMRKGNVLVGGEESGGLSILGHIPEKDGILACLVLLEIQSYLKLYKNGLSLSQYLENIYQEFGYFYNERIDLKVPIEKMAIILEYFKSIEGQAINNAKINEILTKDGVKLILDNKSWFLIRASGTEPLMRCYIESRDIVFFKELKNYIVERIESFKK